MAELPARCPVCDGDVMADPDPRRVGWLFCPGCERAVWMPLLGGWVRLGEPADVRPIVHALAVVELSGTR